MRWEIINPDWCEVALNSEMLPNEMPIGVRHTVVEGIYMIVKESFERGMLSKILMYFGHIIPFKSVPHYISGESVELTGQIAFIWSDYLNEPVILHHELWTVESEKKKKERKWKESCDVAWKKFISH